MTLVVSSAVLRVASAFPLRLVSRLDLVPGPGGAGGAAWEPLSQAPDDLQREALAALARTVGHLAGATLAIATLALALHAVSRVLRSWRAHSVRAALGAPLRHLVRL